MTKDGDRWCWSGRQTVAKDSMNRGTVENRHGQGLGGKTALLNIAHASEDMHWRIMAADKNTWDQHLRALSSFTDWISFFATLNVMLCFWPRCINCTIIHGKGSFTVWPQGAARPLPLSRPPFFQERSFRLHGDAFAFALWNHLWTIYRPLWDHSWHL